MTPSSTPLRLIRPGEARGPVSRPSLRLRPLHDGHRNYLPWHRESAFRKGEGW